MAVLLRSTSCPLLERPGPLKVVFRLNHDGETSLLVVVFTQLLRSNDPISRTRSTSHLADFFPVSAAIIVPGDPKSCGISTSPHIPPSTMLLAIGVTHA